MADAGLDDFFAKKDKGKKKGKSKFTATDILEKKDDSKPDSKPEVLKKTKKKKEKKEQSQNAESVKPKSKLGDDEEWVDYVDEVKDYSGLRIQTLQLSSKEDGTDEKDTEDNDGSEDENGEIKQKGGQSGPWRHSDAPLAPQPAPPPVQEEPPPKKEETPEPPKTTGKYIPPSRRAAMEGGGMSSASQGPTHSRRKKEAPNIQSEFDFPTLGGEPTGPGMVYSSGAHFERVKGGGKQSEDPSRQQQKLEIGNKFDALTNADWFQ